MRSSKSRFAQRKVRVAEDLTVQKIDIQEAEVISKDETKPYDPTVEVNLS